ncbi:hypothetical protein PLICRDRAFT_269577 [Plicaturopsis crispa FD-325 SS-3]|nr:hypothetical protein PLICRDRAFT_269577 [Plicaturopsis crispa FD-325 SS-3]
MAKRPPLRALLIDLSGTLHVGSTATPNAVSALARLRTAVPFRFCSNTSKESTSDLRARLQDIGFAVHSNPEEVWTTIGAMKALIRSRGIQRPYFLMSDSTREELASGLAPAPDVPYDAVLVGLAPAMFTYEHLNTAFRLLAHESSSASVQVPLIATHRARYFGAPDGHLSLGPGPFVAALEHASGASAEVVGKPSRGFFETVIASFGDGVDGDGKIAVVGDDVEADLGGGAVELGLWRVLVKTGKYRPGDEHRPGLTPPDEVWETFADFVEDLLSRA